jgi:asparagine synthase (glutamine-hydrolysing)
MGALLVWLGHAPEQALDRSKWHQRLARIAHRAQAGVHLEHGYGCSLAWCRAGIPAELCQGEMPRAQGTLLAVLDGWTHQPDALERWLEAFGRTQAGALAEFRARGCLWILDRVARTLTIARDAGGERTAFFSLEPDGAWISSDADALVEDPRAAVSEPLVVRYLLGRDSPRSSSYWPGIERVEAGRIVRLDAKRWLALGTTKALELDFSPRTDSQACERFNELLDQATSRASRGVSKIAVSLSGGLDSGALAASLHRLKLACSVHAWSLRGHEADESDCIEATARHFGFDCSLLDGLRLPPLSAPLLFRSHRRLNPYRELKQAVYQSARTDGAQALLNGDGGDQLYGDASRWFVDQVKHGPWRPIFGELWFRRGTLWRDAAFRRLLRWLSRTRASPGLVHAPWNAEAQAQALELARTGRETPALWPELGEGIASEHAFAEAIGLELRSPLRDPELLSFVAGLAPYQRRRAGVSKWLARAALRGLLPDAHRLRSKQGNLTPLLKAALQAFPGRVEVERLAALQCASKLQLEAWQPFARPLHDESELAVYWRAFELGLRLQASSVFQYTGDQDSGEVP